MCTISSTLKIIPVKQNSRDNRDTYADNTRAQYAAHSEIRKNVSTAAFNHRLKADKGASYFSLTLPLSSCKNRAIQAIHRSERQLIKSDLINNDDLS